MPIVTANIQALISECRRRGSAGDTENIEQGFQNEKKYREEILK